MKTLYRPINTPWNSDDEFVYPQGESSLSELSKYYKIGIIANQRLGSEQQLARLGLFKFINLVIASAKEIALKRTICKPDKALMVSDILDKIDNPSLTNITIPSRKHSIFTTDFGGFAVDILPKLREQKFKCWFPDLCYKQTDDYEVEVYYLYPKTQKHKRHYEV